MAKKNKGKRLGNENPNWNPNLTQEEREHIRWNPKYTEWRMNVFKRDGFSCRKCNDKMGGNLNAHHILNYKGNNKIRYSIVNGITLCEKCHIEFHKKYGNLDNNKEQLNEFMKNTPEKFEVE